MTRLFKALFMVVPALLTAPSTSVADDRLAEILSAQPDEVRARYQHRHPGETLEFFGIEPGMTVVEVLPGGGWYTKILLPHLGANGKVIGADYSIETWAQVYSSEDFLASRETWVDDWTEDARSWFGEDGAVVDAFVLGSLPESMHGTADAFLFIRAMHNLNYTAADGAHLNAAIKMHGMLSSLAVLSVSFSTMRVMTCQIHGRMVQTAISRGIMLSALWGRRDSNLSTRRT